MPGRPASVDPEPPSPRRPGPPNFISNASFEDRHKRAALFFLCPDFAYPNGRCAPSPLRRKRRRPQIRRNRRRRPPIGCQRRRTEFQSGRFETTWLCNEASARGGISERALGWWFWGLTATCFRRQQQHLTRFSGDRILKLKI